MKGLHSIDAFLINSKRFSIFLIVCMGIGTAITVLAAIKLNSLIIIIIGLFFFWICPSFFLRRLRKPFTKKVSINFYNDYFSVEIFNRKTKELERNDENKFSEIKSFKIMSSSTDDSSFLKINFKDGNNVSYTFLGQNKIDSKTDVTELVVNYIHSYNDAQNENERIVLAPNLFASKAGSYYIGGLTALLIISISLQIIYKPKTIPYTIFAGIVLFILIMAQRKRDVTDLEKFNKK